jgi:hypothetical protein
MKKLLVFSLCSILQTANAQPPELMETNWFVDHIVLDGVTYLSPIIGVNGVVNPNIEFDETISFAVLDPESDSFFSDIIYDPNDQEFTFTEPHITLPGCNLYCDFAMKYFELLAGDFLDVHFTYEILITDAGNLFLVLTDDAGNQAFYQDTPILGVSDLSQPKLIIYPNPTSNLLFISSERAVIQKIAAYNLGGKVVIEASENLTQLDVTKLPAGIYFAEITSAEGIVIQKFIKK